MNNPVLTKIYPSPPICEKEILRYAGCKDADETVTALVKECLDEAQSVLSYKICFREFSFEKYGRMCDFGDFSVESENLANNLNECEKVIIFAATVGVGIDRLISKYSRISPSKALMFQAIGTERIEALCDMFCRDTEKEYGGIRPRFSAGYGDVPLECQKDIFSLLDCERKIGLTLNDSLLMSPTKSVTAFVGIGKSAKHTDNKCENCNMKNCSFRGAL